MSCKFVPNERGNLLNSLCRNSFPEVFQIRGLGSRPMTSYDALSFDRTQNKRAITVSHYKKPTGAYIDYSSLSSLLPRRLILVICLGAFALVRRLVSLHLSTTDYLTLTREIWSPLILTLLSSLCNAWSCSLHFRHPLLLLSYVLLIPMVLVISGNAIHTPSYRPLTARNNIHPQSIMHYRLRLGRLSSTSRAMYIFISLVNDDSLITKQGNRAIEADLSFTGFQAKKTRDLRALQARDNLQALLASLLDALNSVTDALKPVLTGLVPRHHDRDDHCHDCDNTYKYVNDPSHVHEHNRHEVTVYNRGLTDNHRRDMDLDLVPGTALVTVSINSVSS